MYKLLFKNIIVAFFAMCLITSCEKSVKGKWTDADKAYVSKGMITETEKMIQTNNYIKMFNMSTAEIKAISDCYLAKLEATYTPAELAKATKEIKEFAKECISRILLGKKGAWSSKFKEMIKTQISKHFGESFTAEQQAKLTECVISKAESELAPSEWSNADAAVGEIFKNCLEEIMAK